MMKSGLVLLAGTLVLGMSATAEAKWLRADTKNFIIYSEGTEKSLRSFAENLQRFDATLSVRFNLTEVDEPNRLTIYLMPRGVDVGRLVTGKNGSFIAGWYSPDPEGSYAISHRENVVIKGTPQSQQTLFHEYSHHFMKRYAGAAFPAWFIEGFAEYYSTVDFTKDGHAEIGKPVYARAYGLLAMPKVPAEKLLLQRPGEMRNSGQTDVYYGRSWLLTHMLYNDPARAGQLGRYIDAINRGEDAKKAATDAFGNLAELDKELNRYLNKPMTFRTSGQPIPVPGKVDVVALSAAEDALLPLRVERISAKSDDVRIAKVRDDLKALSLVHGGDAGVWFELATAEWALDDDKRDRAAARAAVDKALTIDPKHVRANVLLGRILTADVEAMDDPKPEDWNAVRKPIALANRTNPDDPLPLYAYFKSFVDQGRRPPPIAIEGLGRAFQLARENIGVRVSYAFALANDGKYDEALALAKAVAFDPHDNGQGERLLAQLESMRDRSKGRASAADSATDE
ncbi:MAG: tetratricopeptide repeat protein [Sphingopyxis sp.]|nr:tetratricopeptide repeat protein [Sphingopyxis sp.]